MPFNNIDDDSCFYDALSEFWFDTTKLGFKDLEAKVFIPFETNSDNSHHPLFDIDPDLQYFNQINRGGVNSDYFTSDSFVKKWKQKFSGKNVFSLLHANICNVANQNGKTR